MAFETKKYKNTGLEYMEGKEKFLFRHGGVIILKNEFTDWDAKGILMAQVLGLADKPDRAGYDFDHAVETGTLRRKRHEAPDQKPEPAPVPASPPPLQSVAMVEEEPDEDTEEDATEEPTEQEVIELAAGGGNYQVGVVTDNGEKLHISTAQEAQTESAVKERESFLDWIKSRLHTSTAQEPEVDNRNAFQRAWDKTVEQVAESWKPKVQKKKHTSVHDNPVLMLVVIIIVGLGSLVMSGYHIYTYMFDGGRPDWISLITGVIMALFSAIAFTSSRHFWGERGLVGRVIAVLFSFFGVIVIAFAMFATIKVNFDQFQKGDTEKVAAVVEKSTAIKTASTRDEFIQSELKRLDAAIKSASADAARSKLTYDTENDKGKEAWNADARWRAWVSYTNANKLAEKLTAERKPFADEVMKPTGNAQSVEAKVIQDAKDATVFGMFAKLFGMEETLLKFIVYVIPAVFYDLMSPFALTVAFMLYEDRKREEEEEDE